LYHGIGDLDLGWHIARPSSKDLSLGVVAPSDVRWSHRKRRGGALAPKTAFVNSRDARMSIVLTERVVQFKV
jgi:hypothetical protein